MKLGFKYTIIYTLFCLLLFWSIIKYGSSVCNGVEGFSTTDFEKYSHMIVPYPKDAVINYNDLNSPSYSHTVNLPINDPVSCKNFCGPKSQCLITGEQCTSDIDCTGCNPGPTPQDTCITKQVEPYDATGKLGQNQGLNYSPLTTGYNNHNADFAQVFEGSKDAKPILPYQGKDMWTKVFNSGTEIYNKKRNSYDKYSGTLNFGDGKLTYYETNYPMRLSATGQFYETTPPASNSSLY